MRVLLISDIHANLAALETVLADAEQFEPEQIWCIGDVIGYGPAPNECCEIVRAKAQICVPGNHDYAAIGKLSLEDFNPEARFASEWTRCQLHAENAQWLGELPEVVQPENYTVVHASPREPIWEYIINPSIAFPNFAYFSTRICFVGHTHVPALFRWEPTLLAAGQCRSILPDLKRPIDLSQPPYRWIVNPGSVGQPRDSDPRASYAMLDTEKAAFQLQRIAYPIETTQAEMRQAGLPERLITRLEYGW